MDNSLREYIWLQASSGYVVWELNYWTFFRVISLTATLITPDNVLANRSLWSTVLLDFYNTSHSYHGSQNTENISRCITTILSRLIVQLDISSIDLAGLFSIGASKEMYLLVTVDPLAEKSTASATKYNASNDTLRSLKEEMFLVSGGQRQSYRKE